MDLHISAEHVFIACGYTDMRKSIDGLSAIIAQQFQMDPFQPSLFLFCGRRRDRFKALLWQGDGFLLLYKRFEKGRLQWPRTPDEVRELTPQQYRWLMEGLSVEQPRAVQKITPKTVCRTNARKRSAIVKNYWPNCLIRKLSSNRKRRSARNVAAHFLQ